MAESSSEAEEGALRTEIIQAIQQKEGWQLGQGWCKTDLSKTRREGKHRWMLEACKPCESCSHDLKFTRKFMMVHFKTEAGKGDLLNILLSRAT